MCCRVKARARRHVAPSGPPSAFPLAPFDAKVRDRVGALALFLGALASTAGCGQLDHIPFGSDLPLDAGSESTEQCSIQDAGYPTEPLSGMLASLCQSAPLAPGCPLQVCKVYVEAGCVDYCVAYIRRLLELRYGPLDAYVPP